MAGKSLSELNLIDEKIPELDLESIPEFGSWSPPPQPGPYRFRLPKDLSNIWDSKAAENGKPAAVIAVFDKDNPLLIVQGKEKVGEPFETRLSSMRRPRGREKTEVSDLDLLLKAIGITGSIGSIKGYIEKLKTKPGAEFGADITYSWQCSDTRAKRYVDDTGKNLEYPADAQGVVPKGCGAKFYQDDRTAKSDQKVVKQPDGTYPFEIQCSKCGNVVRAFANLDNVRS